MSVDLDETNTSSTNISLNQTTLTQTDGTQTEPDSPQVRPPSLAQVTENTEKMRKLRRDLNELTIKLTEVSNEYTHYRMKTQTEICELENKLV